MRSTAPFDNPNGQPPQQYARKGVTFLGIPASSGCFRGLYSVRECTITLRRCCCVVVFYLQSRSTATSNGVVFMQKWTLQLCLPTCCRMCLNLWRRVLLSMPGSLSMQARHGKYRYSRYLFGKFRQSDVFKVHFLNRVEGHKI